MTQPLTAAQLDEIATRAATLHEYGTLTDEPLQADLDQLTGPDVDALLAEVRRLQRQRKYLLDQLAKRDAESGRGDQALREFLGGEEQPADRDTLPAWLAHRFDPRGPDWEQLGDDDRTYWEHQARAVRRAVVRNGFKTPRATPTPA